MGPRLCKALPKHLRDLTSTDKIEVTVGDFKNELDSYLAEIPDEPLIPHYTQYRRIETNSLIDWIPYARRQTQFGGPEAGEQRLVTRVDQTGSP